MGAEHSLPAAAVRSARPAGLHGLLLVAPGPRGRYGLRTSDKLGFAPTGEGTFGLSDFAPQLKGLRLAQLHAGLDPLDSIDWFKDLQFDLRLWKFPRAFHDFSNANDKCLALTDKVINAPLANTAEPENTHDRAMRYIYKNFNRLYGYKSLFEFKKKYQPQWRGSYLAYRSTAKLPWIGYAMVSIHVPGGVLKLLRS